MTLLESRYGLLGAGLIALGVAVAGWLIGQGFEQGRRAEHYVTVKGDHRRAARLAALARLARACRAGGAAPRYLMKLGSHSASG
jgi:hypothetical protein